MGDRIAMEIGNNHEAENNLNDQYIAKQTEMDLHNNQLGRDVYRENRNNLPYLPDEKKVFLATRVLRKILDGEGKRIVNGNLISTNSDGKCF